MCKRTTEDPLVRFFLDRYSLNLLQIPRADAAVGDLYAVRGDRALPPGRATDFLVPPPRLPRVRRERLADLSDVVSDAVSVHAGLGLLEGFLTALGAGALSGRVRAQYASTSTHQLRFQLEEATREFVSPFELGTALQDCQPRPGHPLANNAYRYYLTVGLVRTPSLTVLTESKQAQDASLETEVAALAEASGGVKIEQAGSGATRYGGQMPLAIGVELLELVFDDGQGRLRIKSQERPVRVRGDAQKALIGDPDGDAFVQLD
jgi:hypothetical protein